MLGVPGNYHGLVRSEWFSWLPSNAQAEVPTRVVHILLSSFLCAPGPFKTKPVVGNVLSGKMNFGSIVNMDWQSTAEGETILQHFYNPLTSGRKLFGRYLSNCYTNLTKANPAK